MQPLRISASSYSNTAPLIWSILYGSERGKVELILDNAPARSAELLDTDRVAIALVPAIASQLIDDVKLVPDVCVGARERVRSVCLVTKGRELDQIKSVSLDTSSRTSAALTKIFFREFLRSEPVWQDADPNIENMLEVSDAALLIGDPALQLWTAESDYILFDLAQLWRKYTGLGFIFAMWMTRRDSLEIDLAAARDEGVKNIARIAANYEAEIGMSRTDLFQYLTENISYSADEEMLAGMDLYFDLAAKHGLTPARRTVRFLPG
ncbi:MAG: menaquinone biosynthesis protein [Blastocatellia bacterium]|nr:menaquinone biosynthesis protein [Blastocatellia bacterium]